MIISDNLLNFKPSRAVDKFFKLLDFLPFSLPVLVVVLNRFHKIYDF